MRRASRRRGFFAGLSREGWGHGGSGGALPLFPTPTKRTISPSLLCLTRPNASKELQSARSFHVVRLTSGRGCSGLFSVSGPNLLWPCPSARDAAQVAAPGSRVPIPRVRQSLGVVNLSSSISCVGCRLGFCAPDRTNGCLQHLTTPCLRHRPHHLCSYLEHPLHRMGGTKCAYSSRWPNGDYLDYAFGKKISTPGLMVLLAGSKRAVGRCVT